jgi:two-component system cell cycle sensor histidine kinase/response regulator CckA
MKKHFVKNLSIRRKQMFIIMLTTSVSLLLACAIFAVYEITTFKAKMVNDLSTLAKIIGNNTAASLDFDDPKSAEQTLSALKAQPSIMGACVFSKDGKVFAHYDRQSDKIIFAARSKVEAENFSFGEKTLTIFEPINSEGEVVGTVYLASDMRALHERLMKFATITSAIFVLALFVAFLLSARLQRLISGPILQLAQIAKLVALEKNYSVRATKRSNDELGQLVDGFNEMLAQIQSRDADLQTARTSLEQRVEERTKKLAESLSLLNATLESTADGIVALDLAGKIISINTKFTNLWHFPAAMLERLDSKEMKLFTAQQVKDPEKFIQRMIESDTDTGTELFDVVELKDGRTFERYVFPQVVDVRRAGTVINYRDVTERKRAEEAVQRQQTELRALFDLMPAMIWFKDTNNGILRVNQRVAEAAGKSVAEIEGKSSVEIYPVEAAKFYADDLAVIQSGVAKLGYVEPMRSQDGKELWVQTDKVPVRDPDGKVVGIVVMAQDITERKRGEVALQESKLFLQSTLDALSAHIAILDEYGKILEVNRAWNQFAHANHFLGSGYGIGDNYLQLCDTATGVCAVEAPASAKGIRAVMAGEIQEFQLEYPCHSPTEQRWFIMRVTRFGEDGGKRIVVAHENITARKLAETARGRLAAILEATTDMVSFSDPAGKILYFNRAGREQLGMGLDEDVTKLIIADFLSDPANSPIVTEGIPAAIRDGTWSGETVLLSRGGKEIPISQVILAHKSSNGKLEFLSTIMRDTTERKKIEAQLFQSQKMETVGKLAGGIAHEFNSIMTAIIGQSELLLADLPSGNPFLKNVKEIHKAAERAAILTRQLLAYGRKQILQPEIYDLNMILSRMETVLRHLMGGNVDMRLMPAIGLKTIKVDAGQIEQVIVNMAMNAVEAMPHGGKLTIETSNITLDPSYTSSFPELKPGNYIMLAITDTGIGMSKEVKSRVFEPFFSTKEVGKGTGLGLATCYGIIKQSGGHINVYSEPGRGSTFKIYLPQIEAATIETPAQRLDTPNLPRGIETILLVEDDPALREMATTLLRRLGYTVLAAANGIEALSQTHHPERGHIDLLFTDVVMPHMSGKELADRIQSLYPHTKILFTSAYTENSIIHQGVLNEGIALLQKPFTPSALAQKVREILNAGKARE